mmetsp:Transcript_5168/g.7963  ORF Transcript_5168/g.7963 Transcript_5168/m.7963 type:complete len:176 (+) Transcript_5168:782-1309(+)
MIRNLRSARNSAKHQTDEKRSNSKILRPDARSPLAGGIGHHLVDGILRGDDCLRGNGIVIEDADESKEVSPAKSDLEDAPTEKPMAANFIVKSEESPEIPDLPKKTPAPEPAHQDDRPLAEFLPRRSSTACGYEGSAAIGRNVDDIERMSYPRKSGNEESTAKKPPPGSVAKSND